VELFPVNYKEALEGSNTIMFSGTGGWDIGQVSIVLER